MKYLAALFCLFLSLGAVEAKPVDPYSIDRIVAQMSYPGVHVSVRWATCGEVNAYYQPATKTLTICEELKAVASPAVVRFAAAHEMGHAVIHQLDLPITGLEETAADEIAAYVLTTSHASADVHAMASFWATLGRAEDPEDEHPSDLRRALTLECLAQGSEADGKTYSGCMMQWRHVVKTWNRLLHLD